MSNIKGMVIDGCLGSAALDKSGEMLDIAGVDVSDWKEGKVLLNWEHRGDADEGASAADVVGKILYVKKIFKESDCENDRQRMYWKDIRLPFIYGIGRLFDAAGHHGAQELAAIIRDCHANNEPILVGYSVEGTKIQTIKGHIKQSVLKAVAITVKPCNASSTLGLLSDSNAPKGFDTETSGNKEAKSALEEMLEIEKSEIDRGNRLIFTKSSINPYMGDLEDDRLKVLIKSLLKAKLYKALTAGGMDAAPSSLTGNQALSTENVVTDDDEQSDKKHKKLIDITNRYVSGGVFDKAELRQTVKSELPEVSEDFIDHFVDMLEDIKVKRAGKSFELIIKMETLSVDLKKAAQDIQKQRPNTFEYLREGISKPHTVQHHGANKFSLDGNELTEQEVAKIIDNVKNNLATLRYKKKPNHDLKKAEEVLSELHSMPDFVNKASLGLYALLDFHHLADINQEHGGDSARAFLRSIAASLVENCDCRTFMLSNNQFLLFAKEEDQLYVALRDIREKLKEIVPVGGLYSAQFSAGIGPTVGLAHQALEQTQHKPGMVYSLVFGSEGAIPMDSAPTPV